MSSLPREARQFSLRGRLPALPYRIETQYENPGIETKTRSARTQIMAGSNVHTVDAVCGQLSGTRHSFMNTLKLIWLTVIQLVRQAWLLPREATVAVRQWRRQAVLNKGEAERL